MRIIVLGIGLVILACLGYHQTQNGQVDVGLPVLSRNFSPDQVDLSPGPRRRERTQASAKSNMEAREPRELPRASQARPLATPKASPIRDAGGVRQVGFHESILASRNLVGANEPSIMLLSDGSLTPITTIGYQQTERINQSPSIVQVNLPMQDPNLVRLLVGNTELRPMEKSGDATTSFNFRVALHDGVHQLTLRQYIRRDTVNNEIDLGSEFQYTVDINTQPLIASPRLEQISNRLLTIEFNNSLMMPPKDNEPWSAYFKLQKLGDEFEVDTTAPNLLASASARLVGEKSIVFELPDLPKGAHFRLFAKTGALGVVDLHGNQLSANNADGLLHLANVFISDDKPATFTRGLRNPAGPYVPYHEYTEPRQQPDGFNPSDKVETRVARLYFYRDAHKVAQIINRNVRSYNQGGVEVAHQNADKARERADELRLERQRLEREAVAAAEETRRKEREAELAEQSLSNSVRELTTAQLQGNQAGAAADAAERQVATASSAVRNAADDATRRLAEEREAAAQLERDAAERKQATQNDIVGQLESVVERLSANVDMARRQVEEARSKEIAANERALQLQAREELVAQEQFRREVAAANEDPNTYAPGVPASYDPVQQVSVSVIGEGLIHLRGPLKGINIIRQMIDRIDTPVGQVRVQVHTVNINGERGERIERAATKAELHIEQARFLTMQSSELLRRAIVEVASRKAEEARSFHPGERQVDRDFRYLDSFFGRDFIRELESIDSEFLRTGNKLLSLHSMDTTSLSSALTLMALAKNSTRQEVLQQFEALMQSELPSAEERFLEPRLTSQKRCRLCRGRCRGVCRLCHPDFCMLAGNASFQSLRGFFAAEVAHDDTMTPMQREFIRLAQIFKSRLVTELEYKQRVMERAMIEERIQTDYRDRLQQALQKERSAEEMLEQKQVERIDQLSTIRTSFGGLIGKLVDVNDLGMTNRQGLDSFRELAEQAKRHLNDSSVIEMRVGKGESVRVLHAHLKNNGKPIGDRYFVDDRAYTGQELREKQTKMISELNAANSMLTAIFRRTLRQYKYTEDLASFQRLEDIMESKLDFTQKKEVYMLQGVPKEQVVLMIEALDLTTFLLGQVQAKARELQGNARQLELQLSRPDLDPQLVYAEWRKFQGSVVRFISDEYGQKLLAEAKGLLGQIETAVLALLRTVNDLEASVNKAELFRRPLDQKKFLDMLVDDLEEKYIELLEGTRAHTANIDNYIKRLTTAFDDDLNNQFYEPAFQQVRAAGRKWDVQFGQIESTGVLANNRSFAKVAPRATMEFDLPERKALFIEGIDAAKAIIDDAGALVNDPSFLAAAAGATGMPVASMPRGSGQGLGVVRDVLPGLNSSSAEHVMAQNRAVANQFGSNLENLIPDPAIYKFETGTGYEIRPVIQPDGQAVVFDFHYIYTTEVREPVRADEKHLGRVRRHFIDTDVQLSNFELRKVSRYQVALKASRTGRGVPLLEDVPLLGVLFRPLPQQESSLQQNIILAQATIFPTLFDLMGMRWAPAVADLDPLRLSNAEFVVRQRSRYLKNQVYDETSSQIDRFLRIPEDVRRADLYRTQETLPRMHPNGYRGDGLNYERSQLQEGFQVEEGQAPPHFIPGASREGSPLLQRRGQPMDGLPYSPHPLESVEPGMMGPEVEVESQPIPLTSPQGSMVAPTAYHAPSRVPNPHAPSGASYPRFQSQPTVVNSSRAWTPQTRPQPASRSPLSPHGIGARSAGDRYNSGAAQNQRGIRPTSWSAPTSRPPAPQPPLATPGLSRPAQGAPQAVNPHLGAGSQAYRVAPTWPASQSSAGYPSR